jgi:hypothetical protein
MLITLICFLGFFTCAAFLLNQKSKDSNSSAVLKPEQKSVEKILSDKQETNICTEYVIKEHKGKMAIFENNSEEPLNIIDIDVINLPPEDKELLKKGVIVRTEEELMQILEDYCS